MGMIRISDEIEKRLKEVADGRSMNSVIEKMLAYCSSPDGFCPTQQASENVFGKLEYLGGYIDKKFDELKALIVDTTVDRLSATRGARRDPALKTYVDWEIMQDILFDFLDEGAPEWVNKSAYEGVHESSDLDTAKFLVQDDCIYIESTYSKAAILNLTPRLKQYLAEKGIVV